MKRRQHLEFWARLLAEASGLEPEAVIETDERGKFIDLAGGAVRSAVLSIYVRPDAVEESSNVAH